MIRNIIYMSTVLLLSFSNLNAQIFVDVNATGQNNGQSWNDAYVSILDAMAAANNGDEIWVAKGTYHIHQGGSSGFVSLELKSGVDLYGGFAGIETTIGQRDTENNITILDGRDEGLTRNARHVIIASGISDCLVESFTISHGSATNQSSALDEAACSVADKGDGGTSKEAVLACVGKGNGGGILVHQSEVTFLNCTISENTAGKGGGIYVMPATSTIAGTYPQPTFENCIIKDNYAGGRGAGVSLDLYADPIFKNCTFSGNVCGDKGGAVYMDWSCSPYFENCLIVENRAIRGAAASIDGSSTPVFVHCTISNNRATDIGAGLYTGSYKPNGSNSNDPIVVNSIVWGNHCTWGGPCDLAVWHENHFMMENSLIGNGFRSDGTGMQIGLNPIMADTANSDYSLLVGSPCIDAGIVSSSLVTSIPSSDITYFTKDLNPDIGAYEYNDCDYIDPNTQSCVSCWHPENIIVDLGTDPNQVMLSWEPVPDAQKYQIRYRRALTADWSYLISTSTTKAITGLVQNKIYDYRIRAMCSDGTWSPLIDIDKFRTVPCRPPSQPTHVQLSNNKVRVEWADYAYADKYQVWYRIAGSNDEWLTMVTYLEGMNYRVLNNLLPGSTYEWKVRSWCEVSYGPFSDLRYFTNASTRQTESVFQLLSISPNPTSDEVVISFIQNPESDGVDIRLFDLNGRLVLEQYHSCKQGLQSLKLSLNEMKNGYHIIELNNGITVKRDIIIKSNQP